MHVGWDIDEATATPDGGIKGGEFVISTGDNSTEILPEEVGVLSQGGIGIGKDHPLTLPFFFETVINSGGISLGLAAG